MVMNNILVVVIGVAGLALGWLIGYNHASDNLSDMIEAQEFIEEANAVVTVENIQFLNAANEIELLKKIDNGEVRQAAQQVIDSLGKYYKISSEAVADKMASENEAEIVDTINTLALNNELFKKVVAYQD